MLSEDQYMERTPDLIGKIRKLREAAEKEMNKFTKRADYDVSRVVGQKSKAPSDKYGNTMPNETGGKSPKAPAPPIVSQPAIPFPSSPLADDGDPEGV